MVVEHAQYKFHTIFVMTIISGVFVNIALVESVHFPLSLYSGASTDVGLITRYRSNNVKHNIKFVFKKIIKISLPEFNDFFIQ